MSPKWQDHVQNHSDTLDVFYVLMAKMRRKYTNLLPCPAPSICSDNAAKDAWAQAAATLGPTAEAKKAT